MALSEFDLISRYFSHRGARATMWCWGWAMTARCSSARPDSQLVAAIDSLVEDVHFPQAPRPARSVIGRSR